MTTELLQVSDPLLEHGEGPVWFAEFGALRCVDMLAGDVVGLVDGSIERNHMSSVVSILRPRRNGGAVIALEDSIVTVDGDPLNSSETSPPLRLFENGAVRLNEGGCDPSGRLLCGTMAHDESPGAGKIYRISADFKVECIRDGVGVSNGLQFAPNGACYYVDTSTSAVELVEDPLGAFRRGRILAVLSRERGYPDGLCIDESGTAWVAMWRGGCVLAISPSGAIMDRIELPVSQVTACTFGDDDLRTLYITTSTIGLDDQVQPEAGALFSCRPGVRGLLPLAFGG